MKKLTPLLTSLFGLSLFLTPLHQGFAQSILPPNAITDLSYEVRGIGGGGAISGFSMSPFDEKFWITATDMGHIAITENEGRKWQVVSHAEAQYHYDLNHAAYFGFSADNQTIFHAKVGCYPKKSSDRGKTWTVMTSLQSLLPTGGYDFYDCWKPNNKDRLLYWIPHFENENLIFAAGGEGLFRTDDKGENWTKINGVTGSSKGTFIDYSTNPITVYHASDANIYKSTDGGHQFSIIYRKGMNGFAGGRDKNGITLAFIEKDGKDCLSEGITASDDKCGNIWISNDEGVTFTETNQIGGAWIRMAENNSQVIYATGAHGWQKEHGIGTSIFKSSNAGLNWSQVFQQYIDRPPYQWDPSLFEMGGIAYDVGLHDESYHSFSIHPRNANRIGGSENYFLHTSLDGGIHWKSPYTEYADVGPRGHKKKWKSNGLEVTSAHHLKFHPNNPKIGYAGYSDIGGLITQDGGETWKITRIMNTIYDHAFDPTNDSIAFAATSTYHDWPHGGYKNVAVNPTPGADYYGGGIFKITNYGNNWIRLTPDNFEWNNPFLSVAYDAKNKVIYAGSQGSGIAKSVDAGLNWEWINNGLPNSSKIIGQIEIDPDNNDKYIMLSGNAPNYTNKATTGIYRMKEGSNTWELLRGIVHEPYDKGDPKWNGQLWLYPVHFAIDWKDPNRQTMWLTDIRIPTIYLAEGVWKTEDGGQNWYQKKYLPDPKKITIHPKNSDIVYVSAMVDGNPNNQMDSSGALHTTDGGETWVENFSIPVQKIISSVTFDPNDYNKIFYTTFGSGIYYGPNPVQINPPAPNTDQPSPNPTPIINGGDGGGGGMRSTIKAQDTKEEVVSEEKEEERGPTQFLNLFIDTKQHWVKNYVEALANKGIITKKPYFYPNAPINRAEFSKILVTTLNLPLPEIEQPHFSDLKKEDWYTPFIEAVFTAGIAEGYAKGQFKPYQSITRAEAVKMIISAYKMESNNTINYFKDIQKEDWFYSVVNQAFSEGLVKGYIKNGQREFRPNKSISRSEAVSIIYKLINGAEL